VRVLNPCLLLLGLTPLLLLSTGCPGRLEDPERFEGDAVEGPCTVDLVERTLLPTSCGGGGCHGASQPAGNLDLQSPGVGRRLVNVKSACQDKLLVGPSGSYFLEKLDARPACGTQMPISGPLKASDIRCLEQYVKGLQDGGAQ